MFQVLWAKGTQYFADLHIWFSTLTRPSHSRFTRAQRLTCCLSLLMSYLAVNAAWYETSMTEVSYFICPPFLPSLPCFLPPLFFPSHSSSLSSLPSLTSSLAPIFTYLPSSLPLLPPSVLSSFLSSLSHFFPLSSFHLPFSFSHIFPIYLPPTLLLVSSSIPPFLYPVPFYSSLHPTLSLAPSPTQYLAHLFTHPLSQTSIPRSFPSLLPSIYFYCV